VISSSERSADAVDGASRQSAVGKLLTDSL
jgi:hypothetical protein